MKSYPAPTTEAVKNGWGGEKKREDARCERIISVVPQESGCMKTISLISAGLINTPPDVLSPKAPRPQGTMLIKTYILSLPLPAN